MLWRVSRVARSRVVVLRLLRLVHAAAAGVRGLAAALAQGGGGGGDAWRTQTYVLQQGDEVLVVSRGAPVRHITYPAATSSSTSGIGGTSAGGGDSNSSMDGDWELLPPWPEADAGDRNRGLPRQAAGVPGGAWVATEELLARDPELLRHRWMLEGTQQPPRLLAVALAGATTASVAAAARPGVVVNLAAVAKDGDAGGAVVQLPLSLRGVALDGADTEVLVCQGHTHIKLPLRDVVVGGGGTQATVRLPCALRVTGPEGGVTAAPPPASPASLSDCIAAVPALRPGLAMVHVRRVGWLSEPVPVLLLPGGEQEGGGVAAEVAQLQAADAPAGLMQWPVWLGVVLSRALAASSAGAAALAGCLPGVAEGRVAAKARRLLRLARARGWACTERLVGAWLAQLAAAGVEAKVDAEMAPGHDVAPQASSGQRVLCFSRRCFLTLGSHGCTVRLFGTMQAAVQPPAPAGPPASVEELPPAAAVQQQATQQATIADSAPQACPKEPDSCASSRQQAPRHVPPAPEAGEEEATPPAGDAAPAPVPAPPRAPASAATPHSKATKVELGGGGGGGGGACEPLLAGVDYTGDIYSSSRRAEAAYRVQPDYMLRQVREPTEQLHCRQFELVGPAPHSVLDSPSSTRTSPRRRTSTGACARSWSTGSSRS